MKNLMKKIAAVVGLTALALMPSAKAGEVSAPSRGATSGQVRHVHFTAPMAADHFNRQVKDMTKIQLVQYQGLMGQLGVMGGIDHLNGRGLQYTDPITLLTDGSRNFVIEHTQYSSDKAYEIRPDGKLYSVDHHYPDGVAKHLEKSIERSSFGLLRHAKQVVQHNELTGQVHEELKKMFDSGDAKLYGEDAVFWGL